MNRALPHHDQEVACDSVEPEPAVIPTGRMVGPLFMITLRPERGVDPNKALRGALKAMLRTYGLRCTAISEVIE
jgi:hypothetical protein